MKKVLLAILLLLSFILVSCAGKYTVREQEMKKYEEVEEGFVKGMPPAVVKTVEAYNDGDYETAAIGFNAIMKNSDWSRLHETARYYYAESLFRMGLYQASEYQLAEILFEGPDGHYFVSSLLKLLAVTYQTNDERVLFAILSNVDSDALPKKFANEILYYLGKISFYNKDDEKALELFSKIKDYSSFYPRAKYFMGVVQVRQQMYAEAMNSFTEIRKMGNEKYIGVDMTKLKGMVELALGELYYAAGFDKNTKNPLAMFNVALNYFNNVDRGNSQWFESLFARTWASMLISRFDSTLGTVITLRSPFFSNVYFPEINIVEAVTFYNLCRYKEVNFVIDKFFTVYPGYKTSIDTYVEDVSTKTGLDVYRDILSQYNDSLAGKDSVLPPAVIKDIIGDPIFLKQYNHIKEIEKELAIVEKASAKFKGSSVSTDLEQKMSYQLITLRDESGKWIAARLKRMSGDLLDLIANAKAIRFEMTDKQKVIFEQEELYGQKLKEAEKKEANSFSPAVPEHSYYWPFDGEYWEDELGYYFYNIQSACIDEK